MQFNELLNTKPQNKKQSDQHCKERENGVIEMKTFQEALIANIANDTICIENKQQQRDKTPQEKK